MPKTMPKPDPALKPSRPQKAHAALSAALFSALRKRGGEERYMRWSVVRVEEFLKAFPEKDPRSYGREAVTRYLREIGARPNLKEWQFRQIVDALEVLFVRVLRLAWADDFDWSFWRDSARKLEANHPTIARDARLPDAKSQQSASAPRPMAAPADQRDLLDAVISEIRRRAYSIRTEHTYAQWIRRFVAANGHRDPRELGGAEVRSFLERLAVHRNVAPSTQNQALSALVFLYREVLGLPLELGSFARAKRPRRLPVVLTRQEVASLLDHLRGTRRIMASLLYGTGMRLMEVVRLRVKDVDFGYRQIVVRNAKGAKDRVVPLPEAAIDPLRAHLLKVRDLFEEDRKRGIGPVYVPDALACKYPNAPREWGWQYVFPSARVSFDTRSGTARRHHIHENGLQKGVKAAALSAGLTKRVNCHSMRHSFATHLLEEGYDIRTVQELLGHADVSTTMIYTHVLNRGGRAVRSPLDFAR
jgi:integron integrase